MYIKPNTKLLIIDDRDEDMLHLLVMDLKEKFPNATIHYATGFKGIEEKIIYGNYHIILVDQNLKNWGSHGTFHSNGEKMIPFIRKVSSEARIIGISGSPRGNELLLQAGADDCILKDEILSFLSNKELLVA